MNYRHTSVFILDRFKPAEHNAVELCDKHLNKSDSRAHTKDIVMGVVKNRPLLDCLIDQISGVEIERINKKLINILRMSFYELIFSKVSAEYAIVNEAVNIANKKGRKSAGFVNAVLRKLIASIKDRNAALEKSNPRKTVPLDESIGCEFNFDILPDISTAADRYLAKAFSLPQWLTNRWIQDYGIDKTRDICLGSNRRPSVYIRPNTLITTAEKLHALFEQASIESRLIADYKMIQIETGRQIKKLPGFTDGLFTIQDLTASEPIRLLNLSPDMVICDMCAAPGSKATQIAEAINDDGLIIATDKDARRLKMVKENCNRLKIKSVKLADIENIETIAERVGFFDVVLLDVPCSNTAVMSKRPEVRFRINQKALEYFHHTQNQLLKKAAKILRPAGRICYSTCSILKDENQNRINEFISKNNQFKLTAQKTTFPSAEYPDADGGYAAILEL